MHQVVHVCGCVPESGVGHDAQRLLVHVRPRPDDADVGEVVLPPRLHLHLAREHVLAQPDPDELLRARRLARSPQVQVLLLGAEERALLQAEVVHGDADVDGERVAVVHLEDKLRVTLENLLNHRLSDNC